jgi:alpha-L-rhamnosidase
MRSKNLLLMALLAMLVYGCTSSGKPGAPAGLRTEYFTNPLGIDNIQPRFSWEINDTTRGAIQTAYQIMVSSSSEKLAKDDADVWNSEKVKSSECQFIKFEGTALHSSSRYFWKVRSWNISGKVSDWSTGQWFETAFLKDSDWKARWISTQENPTRTPPRSVYVRKEFELKEKPANARVYVTGLGNYIFSLNGKRISDELLSPGWTDYFHKIQYQVYDISEFLVKGKNTAGALLGNMWWSSGLGWNGGAVYSHGPLSLLVQIQITYPDGTTELISSDSNWKYQFSPITENHIYHGESYDARLEIAGWNEPGLDDSNWKNMVSNDSIHLRLVALQEEPIRVTREMKPVSVTEPKPGLFVFDLGQNMAGTARIQAQGNAGEQLEIRYAELLHPDGTVAQENLRSAKVTDHYTFKGSGAETYITSFTYHGFRYIQIKGLHGKPADDAVMGLVFHTDAPARGSFECSNPLLNKLWENINWGQISNMMSVPTDCPQRDERLGWMGDAQIFAPTASFNRNMNGFFAKWERDILDGQYPSGAVTDVNPAIQVIDTAKPGWGDAVIAVPYQTYRFYGDKKILEESYAGMMNWVNFMEHSSKNNIYEFGKNEWGGYGDWVAVVPSPTKPTGALYYYYSTKLLSEIAGILGKKDDSARLAERLPLIAKAYQDKYFISDSGHYISNTQTMNLLPVAFGITPDSMRNAIIEKVAKDVVARDTHLSTGFMGTAWLLPLLSDYGYGELAYQVARQTSYPSWGYMVIKDATSMWELWNSDTERPEGMNSRNHFAYGSVGEWYYQYLAGIRPDIGHPGFRNTIIAPLPLGDLTYASASLKTGYGLLTSSWKKTSGSFILNIRIPANTTAEVRIPVAGNISSLSEGTKILFRSGKMEKMPKGIQFEKQTKNYIQLNVGAGSYSFELK